MRKIKKGSRVTSIALASSLLLALSFSAQAAKPPLPGQLDTRLRSVSYDPLDVTEITAYPGYQIMFEFGDGETIENVALGDAQSWQVTPTKSGEIMFLKPVIVPARTNMTIITNKRRYHLDLSGVEGEPASPEELTFNVRFHYPAEEAAKAAAEAAAPLAVAETALQKNEPENVLKPDIKDLNFQYRYKGDKENLPDQIYDDGKRTYLRWREDQPLPAILRPDGKNGNSIVNFSIQQDHLVLDMCAPELLLRYGKHETRLFNMRLYDKKRGRAVPQTPNNTFESE